MSSFWGRHAASELRGSFPSEVQDVLSEILALNSTWSLIPEGNGRSYGRIPGEKEIRLWPVPETTGAFLHFLASAPDCLKVIEIGSSAGYSTLWMAQALRSKPSARLDTWEILPEKILLAHDFVKKSGLDHIIVIRGEDAEGFHDRYTDEADLIFLDADKENYSSYLHSAATVLRKGGLLVVDNAVDFGGLMIQMHEELICSDMWMSTVLDMDNGLVLARKTDLS